MIPHNDTQAQQVAIDEQADRVIQAAVVGPDDKLVVSFPGSITSQQAEAILDRFNERGFGNRVVLVSGAVVTVVKAET